MLLKNMPPTGNTCFSYDQLQEDAFAVKQLKAQVTKVHTCLTEGLPSFLLVQLS